MCYITDLILLNLACVSRSVAEHFVNIFYYRILLQSTKAMTISRVLNLEILVTKHGNQFFCEHDVYHICWGCCLIFLLLQDLMPLR